MTQDTRIFYFLKKCTILSTQDFKNDQINTDTSTVCTMHCVDVRRFDKNVKRTLVCTFKVEK